MKHKLWLPTGRHTDLHIERSRGSDAGAFTGGGWKGIIHITVSPWFAVDSMVRVLHDKRAEPHLVIGGRPGTRLPVLVQQVAFNRAGRALAHPYGTLETNRANCIQMEICATVGNAQRTLTDSQADRCGLFDMPDLELPADLVRAAAKAADGSDEHRAAVLEDLHLCMHEDHELARAYNAGVAAFTEDTYRALSNAWRWVVHRVPISARAARAAQNTTRFTESGFVNAKGFCGHMHVPNNDHVDPTTAFRMKKLARMVARDRAYDL